MTISIFKFYGEYYAIVILTDEWTGKSRTELRKVSTNDTITINGTTYDISEYLDNAVELQEFAI